MSSPSLWPKFFSAFAVTLGVGYVLLRTTVPTPQQTYEAMAPDLRAKVDANRRAREDAERASKDQPRYLVADSDDAKPVWSEKR